AGVRVQAAKLSLPGVQVQQLEAQINNGASGAAQVVLRVDALNVAALGWRAVKLDYDGDLQRLGPGHWRSAGAVQLRGAPGGALRQGRLLLDMDRDADTLQVHLSAAGAKLDLALPLDQLSHMQIDANRVPLGWLQGLLAQVWSDGKLGKGSVDAKLSLDLLDHGLRSAGNFHLRGAGFDSRQGTMAAQALDGSGRWRLDSSGKAVKLSVDASLDGGDVLLGPLYAALPAHPAQLHVDAKFVDGSVSIPSLRFNDGDALRLDASVVFNAQGDIDALHVAQLNAQLPQAYQRYAKTWMATLGFADVRSAGKLSGSLDFAGGTWRSFSLDAEHVDVHDPDGHLGANDLNGQLNWSHEGTQSPTTLAWQNLRLWSLPLGAASTHWRSHAGVLSLNAPVSIPLLGGQVFLQQLDWRPTATDKQKRLAMALVVTDVNLPALCKVFGWPTFQGSLGGAIPGLSYRGEQIQLDGGLSLHVFDGFVNVTELSLQRPFGNAPILSANIALQDLDLKQLTDTFQFGSISGRLDGKIDALRLVNWKPVAFDAQLKSDGDGRISQGAIDSLSNLGGGIGGGLQSAVLKIFHSFGYSQIGLSCLLRDDVCHMGGVASNNGGYTIVAGRGLPHIEVIGHQHEVDWPTLVARLKAATEGSGPTIE
ncbi:MAG: hypothetical protein L0H70_05140, partial [Xanthomonadales bacterium]|nr:hypothetical protein [Xanthomonadales bacterium]